MAEKQKYVSARMLREIVRAQNNKPGLCFDTLTNMQLSEVYAHLSRNEPYEEIAAAIRERFDQFRRLKPATIINALQTLETEVANLGYAGAHPAILYDPLYAAKEHALLCQRELEYVADLCAEEDAPQHLWDALPRLMDQTNRANLAYVKMLKELLGLSDGAPKEQIKATINQHTQQMFVNIQGAAGQDFDALDMQGISSKLKNLASKKATRDLENIKDNIDSGSK